MPNTYNLYNIEASFKEFLIAEIKNSRIYAKNGEIHEFTRKKLTPVSVKNYLSDFRHFMGWLQLYANSQKRESVPCNSVLSSVSFRVEDFIALVTLPTIFAYKDYLISNSLPQKTINRRLSTVRKFCSFCISQGWLKENPAKAVGNIGLIDPISLISGFGADLKKESLDQSVIKSFLDDVREFLTV